jgi:hypothetical protein
MEAVNRLWKRSTVYGSGQPFMEAVNRLWKRSTVYGSGQPFMEAVNRLWKWGVISLVVVKPQTYRFRFLLYTLVRGLSDSNLVLLAKISYNELFTQTHMSLCRRESCTARVLALHSGSGQPFMEMDLLII